MTRFNAKISPRTADAAVADTRYGGYAAEVVERADASLGNANGFADSDELQKLSGYIDQGGAGLSAGVKAFTHFVSQLAAPIDSSNIIKPESNQRMAEMPANQSIQICDMHPISLALRKLLCRLSKDGKTVTVQNVRDALPVLYHDEKEEALHIFASPVQTNSRRIAVGPVCAEVQLANHAVREGDYRIAPATYANGATIVLTGEPGTRILVTVDKPKYAEHIVKLDASGRGELALITEHNINTPRPSWYMCRDERLVTLTAIKPAEGGCSVPTVRGRVAITLSAATMIGGRGETRDTSIHFTARVRGEWLGVKVNRMMAAKPRDLPAKGE